MAINPNIALGVQAPQLQMPDPNSGINALARVLQIKDMQQNQQMNALKMDEYQRGIREQDELKMALSQPGADPYNVLIGKGRVKDATEFAKGKAAAGKDAAETTQKEVETRSKVIAQYRDQLWNVQTPEQAAAWFQAQYADPVIGKFAASAEPLEKAVASIPQDPVAFKDWLQKAGLGMTQYIEKNKPTITTRNTGGTTDTIATEGLTGKTSVLNSVKNTQSPDNAASVGAQYAIAQSNRDAASINAQGARDAASIKDRRDAEMKLADDYRTESKGFAETSTAMKKVLSAIDTADKNPGAALAAGTGFMKILDPSSVVRETELGMALNASGWFDRATNIANTLQNGRVMTATQKANLKKAAEDLFEEAKKAQLEVDASYKKRANDYGMNPDRVIVDRGQGGVGPGGGGGDNDPLGLRRGR